jgi:hypothetical protein
MSVLKRSRVLGGTVALATVATAVAGCGSSHSTQAAAAPSAHIGGSAITQAADVSGAAQGEKISYSLTEQLPSVGKLTVTGTGAFNASPAAGEMDLNVSIPGISSLGAAASALSSIPLSLVLSDKVLYVKLPTTLSSLTSSYTGGKPWVSVDLSKLASMSSTPGLTNLLNGQTSPADPTAALKELQAASSTGITKVGTATVNGVATTEYKATLNLAKLSKRLPAAQRKALTQQLAKSSRQLGTTTVPFDVYIDSAHLIRRLTLNYSYTVQGSTVPLMLAIDFLSYGPQAAPTVPAASDTFDLTNLLSTYSSSLGSQSGTTTGGINLGG